ncbi:MAG: TonB-dependent receptor plug [Bacteroidetes bacterium]|nr:MAG: TonB-dependent receptor plug [Bacteroidota bacterium]
MKNLLILLTIIAAVSFSFAASAQSGQVQGRVIDETNNEPLPFANVVVKGTTVGATTDFDGRFLITGLKPGFITLEATYVGYRNTTSSEIQVTNSKTEYIEIRMQNAGVALQEVEVKANPFVRTEESPLSLQKLGVSEIETSPGSNRDISRVIQSLPGVGSGVSFRNDIIIRGGGPTEATFFLDGVQIPNINHFATQGSSGGAVGILNADFISSVDYYSGAFPANRGNALSGIFEFTQKEGNKEKVKFRGSLGASEISLTADGPAGEKSSFIVSVRRSYLQFLFDVIGLPFLPTFNDYQLKWKTRFDKNNELTIVSIGSLDQFKLNTGIENPTEDQEYILSFLPVNEQWSYAIGAVYRHFKPHSFQTLVLSRNMLNNISYKYPENNEDMPRILDYSSQEIENKLRFENNIRYSDYKFVYSLGAEYSKYNTSTFQKIFIGNELTNLDYNSDLTMFKYSASAQLSKNFLNERLTLSAGLRTDINNYSSSMMNPIDQLSPRVSASYVLTDKWAITGNIGRYFQLPGYTTLGYRDNVGNLVNKDRDIKYIAADHYIAGIQYIPQNEIFFSIEGFMKNYDRYPFSVRDSISLANKGADFGVLGNEAVISSGTGRAFGFEVVNRTKLKSGLNLILSYTFVRSEFEDKNQELISSSWDFRHIGVLTLSQNLKRNWIVGAKWRFNGGLPYTPYDLEKSSIINAWDAQGTPYLDYDNLNQLRFDPFHQLDIRVDKKYFFEDWSLMFYLDIQNLYNFQAKGQDNYVREKDDNGNFLTTDNNTRYVLRGIPNTSGTVLPTIGVMVEF